VPALTNVNVLFQPYTTVEREFCKDLRGIHLVGATFSGQQAARANTDMAD
jgi:hypothetical protein